jgi:hypothetical protein
MFKIIGIIAASIWGISTCISIGVITALEGVKNGKIIVKDIKKNEPLFTWPIWASSKQSDVNIIIDGNALDYLKRYDKKDWLKKLPEAIEELWGDKPDNEKQEILALYQYIIKEKI